MRASPAAIVGATLLDARVLDDRADRGRLSRDAARIRGLRRLPSTSAHAHSASRVTAPWPFNRLDLFLGCGLVSQRHGGSGMKIAGWLVPWSLLPAAYVYAAPLEVYGRLPAIDKVAISPDGAKLAMAVTNGDQRRIVNRLSVENKSRRRGDQRGLAENPRAAVGQPEQCDHHGFQHRIRPGRHLRAYVDLPRLQLRYGED